MTRERRFLGGAAIGVLWGLGHTLTLATAGSVMIVLNLRAVPAVSTGLELLVAVTIVALGALRLRDAFRGLGGVAREHALADHDHGRREVFHSHPHAHGGDVHAHPHLHPSRRLLAALGDERGRLGIRALLVGAVHGLAGTAAVTLLVLATLRTPAGAIASLAVFGLGTVVGMTALTAAMAAPVALALRFRHVHRALAVGSGLGALVFGVAYAVRAV